MSTLKAINIQHPSSANVNLITAANGFVGIGNSAPKQPLVVNGVIRTLCSNNSSLRSDWYANPISNTVNWNAYNDANNVYIDSVFASNSFYYQVGNSATVSSLFLAANGNVGVGTISPQSALQVYSTGGFTGPGTITNAGLHLTSGNTTGGLAGQSIIWTNYGTGGSAVGAYIAAATYGNYLMSFSANGSSEHMRIDNGGNLLIGTSTAGAKLTVNATPTSQWGIDFSQCAVSVANGSSALLPVGAGMFIITDPTQTGATAVYIVGGGITALVSTTAGTFVAPNTSPGAGTASIKYDGSAGYRIYNNIGVTVNFQLAMFRTRTAI